MTVQDVAEIPAGLSDEGIAVWADGGWCVEALVGRELREYGDLDVAISRADETRLHERRNRSDEYVRGGVLDQTGPDPHKLAGHQRTPTQPPTEQ